MYQGISPDFLPTSPWRIEWSCHLLSGINLADWGSLRNGIRSMIWIDIWWSLLKKAGMIILRYINQKQKSINSTHEKFPLVQTSSCFRGSCFTSRLLPARLTIRWSSCWSFTWSSASSTSGLLVLLVWILQNDSFKWNARKVESRWNSDHLLFYCYSVFFFGFPTSSAKSSGGK